MALARRSACLRCGARWGSHAPDRTTMAEPGALRVVGPNRRHPNPVATIVRGIPGLSSGRPSSSPWRTCSSLMGSTSPPPSAIGHRRRSGVSGETGTRTGAGSGLDGQLDFIRISVTRPPTLGRSGAGQSSLRVTNTAPPPCSHCEPWRRQLRSVLSPVGPDPCPRRRKVTGQSVAGGPKSRNACPENRRGDSPRLRPVAAARLIKIMETNSLLQR